MSTAPRFRIEAVEIGRRMAETSTFLYLTDAGVPLEISYRVWVLRSGSRTILVDTGPPVREGRLRGLTSVVDIIAALAGVGVPAQEVDTVLLTHLHWDHAANASAFPRAKFYAQRTEIDFFNSEIRQHPTFNRFYSTEADLGALFAQKRIVSLDGDSEFRPGVRVIKVGGHTPGSQMVCVDTEAGLAIIAGDAIPLRRNYEASIPSGILSDVREAIQALQRAANLNPVVIYPGHDITASFVPKRRNNYQK